MKTTTLNKLKNDKCYCIKSQEDISLQNCDLFSCGRWKKCMQKTNADINKEIKRRNKNG